MGLGNITGVLVQADMGLGKHHRSARTGRYGTRETSQECSYRPIWDSGNLQVKKDCLSWRRCFETQTRPPHTKESNLIKGLGD